MTLQYTDIDNPDMLPRLPGWFMALMVILLLVALSLSFAEEPKTYPPASPVPGGVEIQVAEDGTPRFLIDLAAIDWKRVDRTKWYAKPVEFGKQVTNNTKKNYKAHPFKWILTSLATYGVASGKADEWIDKGKELIGQGDDGKKKEPKPVLTEQPAVVVFGSGNTVSTPEADGVYINGQWNTVEVQQPWQGGE